MSAWLSIFVTEWLLFFGILGPIFLVARAVTAIADTHPKDGDVKQAPGEAPQSGPKGNARKDHP